MKTIALLSIAAALGMTVLAGAQSTPATAAKSDEIQLKMYKVELLAQLMPLLMTKEQIRAILPTIEKVRAEQKKTIQVEADTLAKEEEGVTKALNDALQKGELPPREVQSKIQKVRQALALQRQLLITEWADQVATKAKEVLNSGQYQVMVKTIDAKMVNPAKPDDVKDDQRARAYARMFFLDSVAYDLLVEMSKA